MEKRTVRSRECQRKNYCIRERNVGWKADLGMRTLPRVNALRAYLHGQASISHSRIDLTIVPELPRYLRECFSQALCPWCEFLATYWAHTEQEGGYRCSIDIANTTRDMRQFHTTVRFASIRVEFYSCGRADRSTTRRSPRIREFSRSKVSFLASSVRSTQHLITVETESAVLLPKLLTSGLWIKLELLPEDLRRYI